MCTPNTLTRAIGLVLFVASAQAAAEFDYSLRTGIDHSDNINLSDTQPISQNVLIPGASFSFQQQGSVLQANVVGNLEYRDYLGNAFDSQTLAQLGGQANWTMLPQRLDFTVLDYAGVQPLSTLSTNVPNNLQQTNVLVLGPTLKFRLGNTLRGEADLRYTNSYAAKTKEFNSSRGMAAFRVIKDISPTAHLSANVDTERVTFQNASGGPSYDRTELFGRYVSQLSRFDLDAAAGWSRINFSGMPDNTSPLVRLRVAWRASPQNTFAIDAARQISDSAQDLIDQAGLVATVGPAVAAQPNIDVGNAVISSWVYTERRIETSYTFVGARLSFVLAPAYDKLDYINHSVFNQTDRGGRAGLDYRLTPQTTLSAFANTANVHYTSIDRTDRTTNYGVSVTSRRTRHWSVMLSASHGLRSSTEPGQGYQANEIYLGFVYRR
ncbi:MAG: outer membrane beta-barrel protein [Pseudomonadota bacterium]|nr:outer membrane beta-barrel protein [Xanthomonadaceae bacterium]MDE2247024.1 outer membrane beta-barrel protein [Xanthomonadaceae bacterium]MDE3209780.1 outer membrane beta-barrel protein [Pseudomonadota bacterium]